MIGHYLSFYSIITYCDISSTVFVFIEFYSQQIAPDQSHQTYIDQLRPIQA